MAGNSKAIQPLYEHWEELSVENWQLIMLDFAKFCSEGHIIINKQGEAIPFVLNEAQQIIADTLLPLLFAETPAPISVVIHKARQEGVSVFLAILKKYVATRRRRIPMAHLLPTDKLASDFFEQKAKPLYEGSHPQLLPEITHTTKPTPMMRFRKFQKQNYASVIKYIGSQSRAAGRSGTYQVVILDEYAFYERVDNIERGMLATMPKTGLSLTVYVSTANGINHFYDAVKAARQKGSRMIYLFLPWHILSEYEREPDPGSRLAKLESLTEYEMKLLEIFEEAGYPQHTWVRKLAFYEYTMEIEAKNDQEYMFENYPSTPEESFEASGKPVLPHSVLMRWREQPSEFKYIEQRMQSQGALTSGKITFVEVDRSTIRRYELPKAGRRYMLWVDPSNGEEDGDTSAGVVIDLENMEEVCTFAERIDQTELAEMCVNLARYYNNAMIVPERNMGRVLIEWIRLLGYTRLYVDPSSASSRTPKYGVHMTRPVKNEAIARMRFLMNNGIYKSRDIGFIDDALHFSWKKTASGYQKAVATGVDENNQPYHDDTVMARLTGMAVLDMRRWRNYADSTKPNKES